MPVDKLTLTLWAYLKHLVRRARELYMHIKDRETVDESGSIYVQR